MDRRLVSGEVNPEAELGYNQVKEVLSKRKMGRAIEGGAANLPRCPGVDPLCLGRCL